MSIAARASDVRSEVRDGRAMLTVLAGFHTESVTRLAARLSRADPRLLVATYDVAGLGENIVHCAVTGGGRLVEASAVELDHGCLACAIRLDLLPRLVSLARHYPDRGLAVVLPAALEPQSLSDAITQCEVDGRPVSESLCVDSVITVVDPASFYAGIMTDDDLSDRGLAAADADHRTVAEVVCRQVEYADTVVVWNGADAFDDARSAALLQRLAPWARHLHVDDSTPASRLASSLRDRRRHDPELPDVCARGLEGLRLGVHERASDCGVSSLVFRSRRPFHPERLHDNVSLLAEHTVRGRGHLWLASQPGDVVAWESAGGALSMGWLGRWLDELPVERREEVGLRRRVAASLDWDPYFGDRDVHLAFVGVHTDLVDVEKTLQGCLLTDEELADGQESWRGFVDPFDGRLGIETEEPTPTQENRR